MGNKRAYIRVEYKAKDVLTVPWAGQEKDKNTSLGN